MTHPYHDVAIVGIHNTIQALELDGHDAESIALEGALGALADAGISPSEVDGVVGQFAQETVLELGLGPCTRRPNMLGIPAILEAAALITSGECEVVLMSAGGARLHRERSHTAPWTRPANELVVGYGLFTAAEFALMARRHMITYGTTTEQLATVAATIRNNGHDNPDAVYCGKGPFSRRRHLVVTHGRRPLPSSRLRDDLRGRVRHRARLGRQGHGLAATRRGSTAARPTRTVLLTRSHPSGTTRSSEGADPAGEVGGRAARLAFRMRGPLTRATST